MIRPIAVLLLCAALAPACSKPKHPAVVVQGITYEYAGVRESNSKQFSLERYIGERSELYFVVPHAAVMPDTAQAWNEFGGVYSQTLTGQGFSLTEAEGQRVGVSEVQVVYLVPAEDGAALVVLSVPKEPATPTTLQGAQALLSALRSTARPN